MYRVYKCFNVDDYWLMDDGDFVIAAGTKEACEAAKRLMEISNG